MAYEGGPHRSVPRHRGRHWRVVKWLSRIAGRAASDPAVEHLLTEHQRLHREKEEIDRAMQTNPNDPALLGRIEKLTAEVKSTDRDVLQRLNRPAAQAFGAEETPPLLQRLWRRDHRPKLHRLVRVGVLLIGLTGILAVAGVLTQERHHPSRGSAETTFRVPGSSGYSGVEIVAMVEHKVTEEGVFSAAQESITCPEGTYAPNALVTCTLHSSKGGGDFDVEVTERGISIKMPDEAG